MESGKSVRVVVAMSGGVDSSVVAALLAQQGYQVIGMMMRLWSEAGKEMFNRCCTPDAVAQARRVAGDLGIPFYVIDAQDIFYEKVVQHFINGYAQGFTPNPCMVCNRFIRWNFLYKRAMSVGAQFLATGHYARLRTDPDTGAVQLLRALDSGKDQSYVLYSLTQGLLSRTLFPLGELTKEQVRQLASEMGLVNADRPESQDLCFIGDGDYRDFLSRNALQVNNPGKILDANGQHLGDHRGLAFYTIGQRRGLGISSARPLYVLAKDPQSNMLIVGHAHELGESELITKDTNWISGEPPEAPFHASLKIRYKSHNASGIVTPLDDRRTHVQFERPVRDITPGQAAVFYRGEVCLGGGTIADRQLAASWSGIP